ATGPGPDAVERGPRSPRPPCGDLHLGPCLHGGERRGPVLGGERDAIAARCRGAHNHMRPDREDRLLRDARRLDARERRRERTPGRGHVGLLGRGLSQAPSAQRPTVRRGVAPGAATVSRPLMQPVQTVRPLAPAVKRSASARIVRHAAWRLPHRRASCYGKGLAITRAANGTGGTMTTGDRSTAALAMIASVIIAATPSGSMAARQIQQGTLIHLSDGDVQGSQNGTTRQFLGIPFAAPPIGPLRWRPPAPVTPWQGVLQADTFSRPCAQLASIQAGASDNEDCLYLNVWTPDPAPARPRPVMVWFH